MKKFGRVMLIIGTVIGSGFASGKEIAVFFTRFGKWSYLLISLAFLLFWGVFYLIMQRGDRAIKKLDKSKFFLSVSIIVSLVFTASMFAGTRAIIKTHSIAIDCILLCILLGLCVVISRKKVEFLAKINTFLIPAILFALLFIVSGNLKGASLIENGNLGIGAFYAFLYVALNTSLSSIVIARGERFSKKENFWISFAASLVLLIMLCLINTAILKCEGAISADMPMLFISSGVGRIIMSAVVAIGCLTTLFSLVFTTHSSLLRLKLSEFASSILAVFVPFLASFIGFGDIVCYIYPVASVLGLLLFLLYI